MSPFLPLVVVVALLAGLGFDGAESSIPSKEEILKPCPGAVCPIGPFCFGFKKEDANVRGPMNNPDMDECYRQPNDNNCEDKPYAIIYKDSKDYFLVRMIGKGSWFAIAFTTSEWNQYPPTGAIACLPDAKKVVVLNEDASLTSGVGWISPPKQTIKDAEVKRGEGEDIICQFRLKIRYRQTDLSSSKFRVAFIGNNDKDKTASKLSGDRIEPASNFLTTSIEGIEVFQDLRMSEAKEEEAAKLNGGPPAVPASFMLSTLPLFLLVGIVTFLFQ